MKCQLFDKFDVKYTCILDSASWDLGPEWLVRTVSDGIFCLLTWLCSLCSLVIVGSSFLKKFWTWPTFDNLQTESWTLLSHLDPQIHRPYANRPYANRPYANVFLRTAIVKLHGLSSKDARQSMLVLRVWAISGSGNKVVQLVLSFASSNTFERSSRSDDKRAPLQNQAKLDWSTPPDHALLYSYPVGMGVWWETTPLHVVAAILSTSRDSR